MAGKGHISNVTFPARDGCKKARTVAGCVFRMGLRLLICNFFQKRA